MQKLKLKLKLGSAGDDHDVSPFRRYNEAMRMHIDIYVVRVADLLPFQFLSFY